MVRTDHVTWPKLNNNKRFNSQHLCQCFEHRYIICRIFCITKPIKITFLSATDAIGHLISLLLSTREGSCLFVAFLSSCQWQCLQWLQHKGVAYLLLISLLVHGNVCNACSEGSCLTFWQEQLAASVLDPVSSQDPD